MAAKRATTTAVMKALTARITRSTPRSDLDHPTTMTDSSPMRAAVSTSEATVRSRSVGPWRIRARASSPATTAIAMVTR